MTPMNDVPVTVEPAFLLMKRGLFYRPGNAGYTGIKADAGRYEQSEADELSGVTAIHENDAPMFAPACWEDVKVKHLLGIIAERDRSLAALASAPAGDGFGVEYDENDGNPDYTITWPDGRWLVAFRDQQIVVGQSPQNDQVAPTKYDLSALARPHSAVAPAGDGVDPEAIVSRAVEQVMCMFGFDTLWGPENLRARLSICARQAVHDTAAALARPRAAMAK